MRELLLATTNRGKIDEFTQLLGSSFRCLAPADRPEISLPCVEEDGKTYHDNARKKALAFYLAYGVPTLADDSGLEIDPLQGAPGIHSARFGGDIHWPERWKKVYEALRPFALPTWTARFRAVLCYYDGQSAFFFEGVTEGRIAPAPQGRAGFGYDPIFYSTVLGKTYGEASPEEKARTSHRAAAVQRFLAALAS